MSGAGGGGELLLGSSIWKR